jgi:hypothetical protein
MAQLNSGTDLKAAQQAYEAEQAKKDEALKAEQAKIAAEEANSSTGSAETSEQKGFNFSSLGKNFQEFLTNLGAKIKEIFGDMFGKKDNKAFSPSVKVDGPKIDEVEQTTADILYSDLVQKAKGNSGLKHKNLGDSDNRGADEIISFGANTGEDVIRGVVNVFKDNNVCDDISKQEKLLVTTFGDEIDKLAKGDDIRALKMINAEPVQKMLKHLSKSGNQLESVDMNAIHAYAAGDISIDDVNNKDRDFARDYKAAIKAITDVGVTNTKEAVDAANQVSATNTPASQKTDAQRSVSA